MEDRVKGIESTLAQFPANLKPDSKAIEAARAGSALTAAASEAAAAQPSGMDVVNPRRRHRDVRCSEAAFSL